MELAACTGMPIDTFFPGRGVGLGYGAAHDQGQWVMVFDQGEGSDILDASLRKIGVERVGHPGTAS
jgi:hypothetical protein